MKVNSGHWELEGKEENHPGPVFDFQTRPSSDRVLKGKARTRFDYEAKGKNPMGARNTRHGAHSLRPNKRLDEDPGPSAPHRRLSVGWKVGRGGLPDCQGGWS